MLSSVAPLCRLCAYLAVASIGASLLAFPLHLAVSAVDPQPFDRVFRRLLALTAVVLLPWCLRGAGALDRRALGFDCPRRAFLRAFCGAFTVGLVAAASLQAVLLALGVRTTGAPAPGRLPELLAFVPLAVAAAALVGLLEESYFRGALYGALRYARPWLAVVAAAGVYAAAHLLGGPVADGEVGWLSGLASLARSPFRIDVFLALFAAGVLLGFLRHRRGHVATAAGVHAGWVCVVLLARELSDLDPHSPFAFLAGSLAGSMGWLGLVWIALLGAGWALWERRAGSGRPAPERG
jgi:hypothetical protein